MLKFIPYILKTLWGHRVRTLLTVSGVAVGMFVFCFVGSISEGLDRMNLVLRVGGPAFRLGRSLAPRVYNRRRQVASR